MPEKQATIITCYYKPKPGGLCKRYFRAIKGLLHEGHAVHYLSTQPFPIQHKNCHFHRFPWPNNHTDNYLFWIIFITASPLVALIIGLRTKANRAFAFEPTYGFILKPLCLLKKIPLTIFFRADSITNYRIKKKPKLLISAATIVERISITNSSIYAVSNSCLDTVLRRHPRQKIAKAGVIRNDIQPPQNEKKLMKTFKTLHISCVGVLEDRKNQIFLIHLFNKLRCHEGTLHIYGEGPKENHLKSLVSALNLNDSIFFHGWIDSNIIWKETDLLLLPSLHEGAPNSALEAMSNKIPVLASSIPEHREILPETCILPLTLEKWESALKQAYEKPDFFLENLVTMQESNRLSLIFDWEKSINHAIISTGMKAG